MKVGKKEIEGNSLSITLTNKDIIALLKNNGQIPENSEALVTFKIPEGCDQEHGHVLIHGASPIKITYSL